jgi:hypothetical protein
LLYLKTLISVRSIDKLPVSPPFVEDPPGLLSFSTYNYTPYSKSKSIEQKHLLDERTGELLTSPHQLPCGLQRGFGNLSSQQIGDLFDPVLARESFNGYMGLIALNGFAHMKMPSRL